jgi:hypothetical protein
MRGLPRTTALLPLAMLVLSFVALAPPPATAASRDLVVLADTRYQVEPANHRVHITVDAVATSYKQDTSQGQTYYTGLEFAVQPGATNVAASSGGQPIGATISRREDAFSVISVTFGRGIFYRQSYAYSVSFDLVDAGGNGTRDLRIGTSLAAFPVWAFGTQGEAGSSVAVDVPKGYTPNVQGSEMSNRSLSDGGTLLSAKPGDPVRFFAYVTADRPGAFETSTMQVDVNGAATSVLVRRWEDDPGWGRRITNLMRRGLPVLQRLIGLDYPGPTHRLTVEEAATSRLGEYAGIYDPDISLIRIRYDADAVVTLHEAAHIWFNGTLFADRWIGEAWAEYYGARATNQIGARGATPVLTKKLLRSRIPLNAWGAIGVESLDVEDFAYAATYAVARDVASRTDVAGMRLVWQAADANQEAYLPLHHEPSPGSDVALDIQDWQRLLDLLEERTGARYADLWRRWIVTENELPLIAERQSARHQYAQVVEAADGWDLPEEIRHEMGVWHFAAATLALDKAEAVLDDRAAIEAAAERIDLTPPPNLQQAFEGEAGLDAAAAQAGAEMATIQSLEQAARHTDDERAGVLAAIGLLGTDPDAQLATARDHFEAGDLQSADREASGLVNSVQGAEDAGRIRVAVVGGGILLLDGGWLWLSRARRRVGVTIAA